MTTTIHAPRRCRRRGSAPLELVLMLPFIVIMLLAVMTLASGLLTSLDAEIAVRRDVWLRRHTPWQDDARSNLTSLSLATHPDFDKILGDQERIDSQAAITSTRTATVPVYLRPLRGLSTQSQHTILAGGVWDHDEIVFESQADHPPLSPGRKVSCFTNQGVNLDGFRNLTAISPSATISP